MTNFDLEFGTSVFVMLIGIPCSGKSTFARKHLSRLSRVSPDDIRIEMLGDVNDQSLNEAVWAEAHRRITANLRNGESCYLDATAANGEQRRDDLARVFWSASGSMVGIYLDTPLEVCLARNGERLVPAAPGSTRQIQKVPDAVLRRMHAKLQEDPPSRADGFDVLLKYS